MSKSNGRRIDGGNGGVLHDELTSRRHARSSLRMVERAVRNQWILPEHSPTAMPAMVYEAAVTARDRVKTGHTSPEAGAKVIVLAAETLRRMEADNTSKLEKLDKIERLEEGVPTDRLDITIPEALRKRIESTASRYDDPDADD